jgi:uncharacterized protein YtpQ (UPF0354 family)
VVLFGCGRHEVIDASQYDAGHWEAEMRASSLNKAKFTRLNGQAIAAKMKGGKVEVVDRMHLTVKTPSGGEIQIYLDNAWQECSSDPAHRPEICQRYLDSLFATPAFKGEEEPPPDTNSLVAVIRDQGFLDQVRKFEGTTNAVIHEPLVADLHVLYVFDTEKGMSYLTEGTRRKLGIPGTEIRTLAMANLHRILPEVRVESAGPLFMIKADGNYESSLLLGEKLWKSQSSQVQGELVAAVPARNVLLCTGSGTPGNLDVLRQTVAKVQATEGHIISSRLLVWRNGKWAEWK